MMNYYTSVRRKYFSMMKLFFQWEESKYHPSIGSTHILLELRKDATDLKIVLIGQNDQQSFYLNSNLLTNA